MTLISELLTLPESVHRGDFVLRLSEGITPEQAAATVRDYVPTPSLRDNFDDALRFIKGALEARSSKGAYLHGSFGSGKSHFMAVLYLLLQGDTRARSLPELAEVVARHSNWMDGRKFLMVPYHMIGARSMESAILGQYGSFVRTLHPEAPLPGVYLSEKLFENAVTLRGQMGDEAFFAALNQRASAAGGWGNIGACWDRARFDAALGAPLDDEDRVRLVGDLIETLFTSYAPLASSEGLGFVPLDVGLSIISQHARDLGYDAVILFLDELVLWLASHSANLDFLRIEGQKLAKLVESQDPNRPIPIISFVARQRDLRDLVGAHVAGAHRLAFEEEMNWWEARFHEIKLEDRNLPAIAERRVLKPRTPDAKRRVDEAFAETTRVRDEVMDALLTSKSDRRAFRQLYPFSPALVDVLVAVSSLLQRERTALKVMLQLLVSQRDTLKLGDLVPVGDLFDVIAEGDEAFSEGMRQHFENAQRLYVGKLRPLLEQQHGVSEESLASLPVTDQRAVAFRNDARLAKTLLLSALVPEVEALKALTARRLAALNHGTFISPIQGQEGSLVLGRLRQWASQIGEIHISDDTTNPTITLQLSGVDVDAILQQARHEDNPGNRLRKMRELVFAACGIEDTDDLFLTHDILWRGTKRRIEVVFGNVRDMSLESLRARGDDWRLVIDFPFDQAGRTPAEDRAKVQEFRSTQEPSTTIVWIPSFFSRSSLHDLGQLVLLDYVLTGDRFNGYATHLSPSEKPTARILLENQRAQLAGKLRHIIDGAYGLMTPLDGTIDSALDHPLAEHFQSLEHGLRLQPPVAADMRRGVMHLLNQALSWQFPRHPLFEVDGEIRPAALRKVFGEVQKAIQAPGGRLFIEQGELRRLMRQIAAPLGLGEMGEQHFVLGAGWVQHFDRKVAETGEARTVRRLRAWLDEPQPRGLPAELANLIILTYAEQQNLRFVRHGGPFTGTIDQLPDDLELREIDLPAPAVWVEARQRAAHIFGLSVLELRTASNVSDAAKSLKEQASAARPHAAELTLRLRSALDPRHLSIAETRRGQTAVAAHELVAALEHAPTEKAIDALASARIATSAAAMAKSVSTSKNTAGALERTRWSVIDAALSLTDWRKDDSERLAARLRDVLEADEYAAALAPALERLEGEAAALLARQPPAPPPVPPVSPTKPGRRIVQQETRQGLAGSAATEVLRGIEKALKEDRAARMSLTWTIDTDMPE